VHTRCAILPLLAVQPLLWLPEGFAAGETMQCMLAYAKHPGFLGIGNHAAVHVVLQNWLQLREVFTVVQEAL
jgi:hypothetical protein